MTISQEEPYERDFRLLMDAGTDALRTIQDAIEACPERDILCNNLTEIFEQAKMLRARQENRSHERK